MELWGSSYLLHDVDPVKLVGTLGSSTTTSGLGSIKIVFAQQPGVFAVARNESRCELVVKWDLALTLMALMHVLVLQNRLLRGEAPDVRVTTDRKQVFTVTEGRRASPIVCSWDATIIDVQCNPVDEGSPDELELVLEEEAAAELVTALAERIALNGTTMARTHR